MATDITKTEQEVIVLKAIWELIDEMVNYEMFVKLSRTNDAVLMFNSRTHQRLFNILLVDFLSQPSGMVSSKGHFLGEYTVSKWEERRMVRSGCPTLLACLWREGR